MAYESGQRPARLARKLDLRALPWTAYTLPELNGLTQNDVMAERHLGELTAITVQHSFAPSVRSASISWDSVITAVKSPFSGVRSLHDAINKHLMRNTSNHEKWGGDDRLNEQLTVMNVDGSTVDAVARHIGGLLIYAVDLRDQWITVAVPEELEAQIPAVLVPLRANC